MAIGEMQFYSNTLHRNVFFNVLVPDPGAAGAGPFPGLLQLHGGMDNHSAWLNKSKLAVYAERLPLVVIMPDMGVGTWANWREPGQPYETYIMEELLPACEYFFPIERGNWVIGGLSLGGYGALRLGLKYPHIFSSIYAHSSFFWGHEGSAPFPEGVSEEDRIDGDVYTHADRTLAEPNPPVVTFDCGTEDFLLQSNRDFRAHLEEKGLPHSYHEYPGAHTWEYWDEHVQKALRQHVEVLGRAGD